MRKAVIGIMLVLGACSSANGERGDRDEAAPSGERGQRSFEVGAFDKVSLEGAHDAVITVGGAPSVRAEGDAEVLERLDIRVENGALRVGTTREGWLGRGSRGRVTVYVSAPALTAASLAGAGDMRIDRVQAEAFEGSISGAGDIEIGALQARRVELSIAGAGDLRATGAAEETEVTIAGAGSAALDAFETRRASISIAGSGDVSLRASEAVEGSILGSGNVTVHGPARCSISKLGAGDVRCGA